MMHQAPAKPWQHRIVFIAAVYNIIWGSLVIAFPAALWHLVGAAVPDPVALWRGLGAIIGAFGLGFLVAARNPYHHWLLIAVAAVAKSAGTVGFFWAASQGQLPWSFGWLVLFDDFAWVIPFALIVRDALRATTLLDAPAALDASAALNTSAAHGIASASANTTV